MFKISLGVPLRYLSAFFPEAFYPNPEPERMLFFLPLHIPPPVVCHWNSLWYLSFSPTGRESLCPRAVYGACSQFSLHPQALLWCLSRYRGGWTEARLPTHRNSAFHGSGLSQGGSLPPAIFPGPESPATAVTTGDSPFFGSLECVGWHQVVTSHRESPMMALCRARAEGQRTAVRSPGTRSFRGGPCLKVTLVALHPGPPHRPFGITRALSQAGHNDVR